MTRGIWGTQEDAIAFAMKFPEAELVRYEDVPLVAVKHTLEIPGKTPRYCLMAWVRKAAKPAVNADFGTDEARREAWLSDYVTRLRHNEELRKYRVAESRRTEKASNHYAVGNIIYNSWGYNQTNIDFYQVTKVDARSVVLRELNQQSDDHGGPTGGHCTPIKDSFRGKPFRKVVKRNGWLSFQFGCGRKWDGEPVWTSSYA